ncbi:GntR family transcriptional regulator [Acinetobacter calcoaceticus]|uniref:GntR family transcriptional regulator n=1 Tax=Acinetobacter calcoaceticus TaxID=471 RepID=A0A4R1XVS6_ACICA|nr:GntR family transcriptional regulator [Acinetobacter calcoaceticus]
MFKNSQLETVKLWLINPKYAALPRYARIQRAIRQLILDGVLEVGMSLPASRGLATSLQVSRDTVEMAYSQLHAEGFIERHVGQGSVVSKRVQRLPKRSRYAQQPQPLSLSQRGQAVLSQGGVRDFTQPKAFAPGVPETRLFPLALWEKLQRQVLKDEAQRNLRHSDPQGVASLRQAIANYVNLERGAHATPERVLVLTSSQQAMSLCAQMLLDVGEHIFIEDPIYHGARKAFDAAGLHCIPIALDQDGLQVEQLTRHNPTAKAVFLTPSHQYPTGVTLSLDRRLDIIEWAQKNQSWIIEDDYDSEFHYAGKPTACVQGLDPHQRTIYIGTFTKSLFPGVRIAYMLLPEQLVTAMTVARTLLDGHSAAMPQFTLARFMQAGHYGAYVRNMRLVYGERMQCLVELIQQHLAADLEAIVPSGGLQMPCRLKSNISEQRLVEHAQQAGIDLVGLSSLYAHAAAYPGVLMGFAAYTAEELKCAVLKLAELIHALRSSSNATELL